MEAKTFNSIYAANYNSLVNHFSFTCGQSNRELFEELVNDAFIKLHNDVNFIFNGIESALAYIKKVTKNAFIDVVRNENAAYKGTTQKISDFVNDKGTEFLPVVDNTSKDIKLMRESKKEISQALKSVNAQARKCFIMYYSLGYSNQEIAEKMNISINTVLSHISRTRKQLQKELN